MRLKMSFRYDCPIFIPTKSKSLRFLLACLVRKILTGAIDTERLYWKLDQQGTEAHYLNLLYHQKLSEQLTRKLFQQSVCPLTIDDCQHYERIFSSLNFGVFPFPKEGEKVFYLALDSKFYDQSILLFDKLDYLLGWPRDLANIFFDYIEAHPLEKNLSSLTKKLGFNDWGKWGGKPQCGFFDDKINYFRLDLERRPIKCPFCGSSDIVDVIAGMPAFSVLKGNEFLYGCCVDPDCPPPAWHCNHCGLPIWRTSSLIDRNINEDLSVSMSSFKK